MGLGIARDEVVGLNCFKIQGSAELAAALLECGVEGGSAVTAWD